MSSANGIHMPSVTFSAFVNAGEYHWSSLFSACQKSYDFCLCHTQNVSGTFLVITFARSGFNLSICLFEKQFWHMSCPSAT